MDAPMLHELSHDECLRLLGTVSIGRVGLSVGALPAVFPVNFAILDGDVVFRAVLGTRFHAAAVAAVLAFEADGYAPDGTSGWSVLIQGPSRIVDRPSEMDEARRLAIAPWTTEGAADQLIRIASSRVSGRKFDRPSR